MDSCTDDDARVYYKALTHIVISLEWKRSNNYITII
jgi:hypothetical protein